MKQLLLFFFCFLLGAGGFFGIRYQMTQSSRPLFSDAPYMIQAPKHSAWATVSYDPQGMAMVRGPHDDAFSEVTLGTKIVQGDSVFAQKGGTIVSFYAVGITMEEGSELYFEHLTKSLFMRQRSGVVTYETSEMPIAVRVQRSLVLLETGEMTVTSTGTNATVRLSKGTAKIGNIDTDNVTTTYVLASGDSAVLDSTLRTVTVR